MDDNRVWAFEESLWRASDERYQERVDPECVMVLSHAPHLCCGKDAVEAVSGTPEWDEVAFSNTHISRPEEGLIVVGYHVRASKGSEVFSAACSSVYRRRSHEDWTVVQHAQVATPDEGHQGG